GLMSSPTRYWPSPGMVVAGPLSSFGSDTGSSDSTSSVTVTVGCGGADAFGSSPLEPIPTPTTRAMKAVRPYDSQRLPRRGGCGGMACVGFQTPPGNCSPGCGAEWGW